MPNPLIAGGGLITGALDWFSNMGRIDKFDKMFQQIMEDKDKYANMALDVGDKYSYGSPAYNDILNAVHSASPDPGQILWKLNPSLRALDPRTPVRSAEMPARQGVNSAELQQALQMVGQMYGQEANSVATAAGVSSNANALGGNTLNTTPTQSLLGMYSSLLPLFIDMNNEPEQKTGFGLTIAGFGGSTSCIYEKSRVETPDGAKYLRDIKPGDLVLGTDDSYHIVIYNDVGDIPEPFRKPHLKITTEHCALIMTNDHPIKNRMAKSLKVGDKLKTIYGKSTIIKVEPTNYVISGDLLLDGCSGYVCNGIHVESAIYKYPSELKKELFGVE